MTMLKFEPDDFREYEDDGNLPAMAQIAQKKFDEWLARQKRIYSTSNNNTLWMRWDKSDKPKGYESEAYLIPVEDK